MRTQIVMLYYVSSYWPANAEWYDQWFRAQNIDPSTASWNDYDEPDLPEIREYDTNLRMFVVNPNYDNNPFFAPAHTNLTGKDGGELHHWRCVKCKNYFSVTDK